MFLDSCSFVVTVATIGIRCLYCRPLDNQMATKTIANPDDRNPGEVDSAGISKEASEIFRRMNPAVFDDPKLADEDGFFRRRDLSGFGEKKKDMPEGTDTFQLELAPSGHIVLPCSEFKRNSDLQRADHTLTLITEHDHNKRDSPPPPVQPAPTFGSASSH